MVVTRELLPCRPGVRDAVQLCSAAGVKVTGQSSPNDKLLLAQSLKRKGHVVAVTGDGTNDAPALHEVVCWGRSVYANMQKFIEFQLAVNVAALVINVVAAVSSGYVPLNAIELLWVNLIMDTLGALALATEPPTDNLMKRHPVGRREPLVTNVMWRNLFIQALYQIAVLLIFNFDGKRIFHLQNESQEHADKMKNTFVFNAFVFCQIFNEFKARKPEEKNIFRGVTSNHLFMGIVGILQLASGTSWEIPSCACQIFPELLQALFFLENATSVQMKNRAGSRQELNVASILQLETLLGKCTCQRFSEFNFWRSCRLC